MKRVSSPVRIPLSETSTSPTASASAAGVSSTLASWLTPVDPRSWIAPMSPGLPATWFASSSRPTPPAIHATPNSAPPTTGR